MSKRLKYISVLFALLIIFTALALIVLVDTMNARASDGSASIETDICIGNSGMEIMWGAEEGATSYDIYRSGSRLGTYNLLVNTKATEYTDVNPNANKYENYYKIVAKKNDLILSEKIISLELKMFGETMKLYDIKYDNISDIENDINDIHDNEMFGGAPARGEFTSKRYSLYLKPGEYNGLSKFQVGFYTQLAGLGKTPTETKIGGSVETPPHLSNNNATCTFWRSIENLHITAGTLKWGVSQAAPLRRMKVDVAAEFDWNGGWSSGGFSVDSEFKAKVGSSSQQQWYARNCDFTVKLGNTGGYNHVVQGSVGVLPTQNFQNGGTYTVETTTPVIREKPFLYLENGVYKIFVPELRYEAQGLSWTDTYIGDGNSIDLESEFHVARPDVDNSYSLNKALNSGKHLFFTPGRYELDTPLHIKNANTVVLGTGLATLIPSAKNKHGAIFVEDVDGVTVAGLMLDALYDSKYLICVGDTGSNKDHEDNPILLSDLFLRVGGYRSENVNADICALINSDDVIGDHFWVWRADHGSGVGWKKNTSKNGLVVVGDDMVFYGLFVEHFQEYQTLWLGERGRTYFYQCELPYDPTNQAAYMSHDGTVNGWAAYKVANQVVEHEAVGMGIYAVFNRTGENRDKSESVFLQNAIEVPNTAGVKIRHARLTDFSSQDNALTGISSVVNGAGNGVSAGGGVKVTANAYVVSYSDGVAVTPGSGKTGTQPDDETFNIFIDVRPADIDFGDPDAPFDPLWLIIVLSSVAAIAIITVAILIIVRKKSAKNES